MYSELNSTIETCEYSTSDMNITLTDLMRGEEYSISGREWAGREEGEDLLLNLEGIVWQ